MVDDKHLSTEVTKIETELLPIARAAEKYSIVDQESLEHGIDFLGKVKEAYDRVERTRKFFTGPLLALKKTYDERFTPTLLELERAEKTLKGKLTEYRLTLPENAPAAKTTRTSDAKATFVKVRRFRITDEAAVPKEYLCVDLKKIGKVVDAGLSSIPGVEIYEEEQVRASYAG